MFDDFEEFDRHIVFEPIYAETGAPMPLFTECSYERWSMQLELMPPTYWARHGYLVGQSNDQVFCKRTSRYPRQSYEAFLEVPQPAPAGPKYYEGHIDMTIEEFSKLTPAEIKQLIAVP